MRTMSAVFAPTTLAIRSGVTSGQLRQTKRVQAVGKMRTGHRLRRFARRQIGNRERGFFARNLRQRRIELRSQRQSANHGRTGFDKTASRIIKLWIPHRLFF